MDLDDEELEATRKLNGLNKQKKEKDDITDWLIDREDCIKGVNNVNK